MAASPLPMPHMGVLSLDDEKVLRQMITAWRHSRENPPLQSNEEGSHQAPETYIALPQETTGIPALEQPGTGSGTGTSSFNGDHPGSAYCDIYRISGSDGILQPIATRQLVYNISEGSIEQTWIIVTRDKFGKWLAVVAGGGGVGGKIWFKVISISIYYWELPGCEYIRAEVTQKSCDANVNIGDIVYIFDPFFCWFNLPIAIMMRITGTATFAENGFWDGVTPLVCGVTPGKCFWSVDSVCCLEEDYGAF